MTAVLFSIVCGVLCGLFLAFWNVVRGGWPHMDPKPWWKKSDYLWFISCFALIAGFLGSSFGMNSFGTATGMWLGMLTGWGVYIGGLLNLGKSPDPTKPFFNGETGQWQADPKPEVGWIDMLIKPLAKKPFLYVMAGMFLRGLMAGLIVLAAVFEFKVHLTYFGVQVGSVNLLPLVVAFSAMPLAFFAATKTPKVSSSNMWRLGEAYWGFLIGVGLYVTHLLTK